jgi:hypothetical protein
MEENQTNEPIEEKTDWEQLPWNKHDRYIPTVFNLQEMKKSCHCGRVTMMKDNYCPACGQSIGIPEEFYM